jgi:hypothetical protein
LVEGDKLTIGYLYEAMDWANKARYTYYEDKEEDKYRKR